MKQKFEKQNLENQFVCEQKIKLKEAWKERIENIFIVLMITISIFVCLRISFGEIVIPKHHYYHDYEITVNGKEVLYTVLEEQEQIIIPFLVKFYSEETLAYHYELNNENIFTIEELKKIQLIEYECLDSRNKKIACNSNLPNIKKKKIDSENFEYQIIWKTKSIYQGNQIPDFKKYMILNQTYYINLKRKNKNGTTTITIPFHYQNS